MRKNRGKVGRRERGRGRERERGRGRERERGKDGPVSAYDLICANEEAGGSGC